MLIFANAHFVGLSLLVDHLLIDAFIRVDVPSTRCSPSPWTRRAHALEAHEVPQQAWPLEARVGTKQPRTRCTRFERRAMFMTEPSHTPRRTCDACARRYRRAWAPAARRRGSARLPRWSRAGSDLVTRGHGRRGPRRAQFRSAPSSEHTPQQVSSSSTARVRAARGLFEHGEAHRRACPRGRAFSPPPDEATRPLLGDRRLVAGAVQGSSPVAPVTPGPSEPGDGAVGGAPTARLLVEKRR
jgi:hypothetical protein